MLSKFCKDQIKRSFFNIFASKAWGFDLVMKSMKLEKFFDNRKKLKNVRLRQNLFHGQSNSNRVLRERKWEDVFSSKLSFDSELRCLKISSEPSASKVSQPWWSSTSFIITQIKGTQSLSSPHNESTYDHHNVVWVFDRQRWH